MKNRADQIPAGAFDRMHSSPAFLLTITGRTYPFVAYLIFLAFVLYQLFSGNLLNLTWGVG